MKTMKKPYLGIDIGGTAVKIGLVTETGEILSQDTCSVCFDGYQTPILKTVIQCTEQFLDRENLHPGQITGIGVSATGLIDTRTGVVIGAGDHIPNWNGSRIKEELETWFHLPVTVLNDANSAALGELFCGAAKAYSDVIVVTVGTGIGGGIIVDQELLSGAHGFSGEIGSMILHCTNEPGRHPYITYEQLASTSALVRMVQEGIQSGKICGMEETVLDGRVIFEKMDQNRELTLIVEEWIDYVAAGLVSLIHIFNPSCILIGGGVSAQEERFIVPLRKKVLSNVIPVYRGTVEIRRTELGNNAGLAGAVYYCRRHLT